MASTVKLIFDNIGECGVFGVLLNSCDGSASGSHRRDGVPEGYGEEDSLVGGDIGSLLGKDMIKLGKHKLNALSLLGITRQKDVFFNYILL